MALADYKKDMMRCVRCSTCKFIPISSLLKSWRFAQGCPAIAKHNFHAFSASGKLIMALSLLEGRIEYSPKVMEILYNCTLCGMCDLSCKVGTDQELWEVLHEFRIDAWQRGEKTRLAPHVSIVESIKSYDNVWMQPRRKRTDWTKGLKVKDLNQEKAEVLYFVGCTYSLDPEMRRVARNTAILFNKAGVDFGTLGANEKCCASPAFMVGDEELFQKMAIENINTFNQLGVKKVVTSCAGCFGLIKSKYPRVGPEMKFEVQHSIEFLNQLIQEGKLKPSKEVSMAITYHDPCHLGRMSDTRIPSHGVEHYELGTMPIKDIPKVMGMNGVYDPPREVLKSIPGIKLIEMERRREYAWCCGSGGGVKSAYPELAMDTVKERLEEARATGAETIVSCCPWCEKNFEDGIRATDSELKVVDAVDLLIQSVE